MPDSRTVPVPFDCKTKFVPEVVLCTIPLLKDINPKVLVNPSCPAMPLAPVTRVKPVCVDGVRPRLGCAPSRVMNIELEPVVPLRALPPLNNPGIYSL